VRIALHEQPPALEADLERVTKLWEEGLARFGGPYLAGKRFTAGDAFFCPVAFRAQTYNILTEGAAGRYVQTLLDLTAMRDWYNAALAETFRDPPHEADIEKYGKLTADFRLTA
jgi:glutathione S-transferase